MNILANKRATNYKGYEAWKLIDDRIWKWVNDRNDRERKSWIEIELRKKKGDKTKIWMEVRGNEEGRGKIGEGRDQSGLSYLLAAGPQDMYIS